MAITHGGHRGKRGGYRRRRVGDAAPRRRSDRDHHGRACVITSIFERRHRLDQLYSLDQLYGRRELDHHARDDRIDDDTRGVEHARKLTSMITERRFAIMGSRGHVLVVGGDAALADYAVGRLDQLEARWSRFRPSSEVARLNASGGAALTVSADTIALLINLRSAYTETAGRFNPTVIDAEERLGYDRTFCQISPPAHWPIPTHSYPFDIEIDAGSGLVQLAPGVRIDPGGLGKGLAADMVAEELIERGARSCLVNVGGDLRMIGCSPSSDAWPIAIESPTSEACIGYILVTEGGVATTTSARRRWSVAGLPAHHLIDPATSLPASSCWQQITVSAPNAASAEISAKIGFLDGTTGAAFGWLAVDADGSTHAGGPIQFIKD